MAELVSQGDPRSVDCILPESGPFTVPYAADLFFRAFEHAQGDLDKNARIQQNIFEYIHVIRPSWQLPDHLQTEFEALAWNKVERYLQYAIGGAKAEKTGIVLHAKYPRSSEFFDRARNFVDTLNSSSYSDHNGLVVDITKGIIDLDYHYLVEKNGRVRSHPNPEKGNSYKHDPWLSYLFYFGLEKHATGFSELDQMYTEVVNCLHDGFLSNSREADSQFAQVEQVYREKHPEKIAVDL